MTKNEARNLLAFHWGNPKAPGVGTFLAARINSVARNGETLLATLERIAEVSPCAFPPFSSEAIAWYHNIKGNP